MAKKKFTKKKKPHSRSKVRKSSREGTGRKSVRKGKASGTNHNKPFTERSGEQRLQRALASAGLGSRRECEVLIEEGRVEVDGQVVTKLGAKVNPRKQKIRVDGTPVKFARLQYFAVNKPPGVVSTSRDPSGRIRVIDLINTNERVYNVGRLDKSSEGLILVTNDGDLANRLTHPRYGVQKIYMVQVAGRPEVADLKKLQRGVYLADGLAKVVGTKIKKRTKESTWLEITLDEGRNREIRRLLASIGHKVLRLRRVAIGSLRLGDLPLGAHRKLEKSEVEALWYSGARQRNTEKKSRHVKKPQSARTTERDTTRKPRRNDDPDRKKPYRKRGSDSQSGKASPGSKSGRSAKPKVGSEGWKPKSGGKRRKKKSTAVTRTAAPRKSKRSAPKRNADVDISRLARDVGKSNHDAIKHHLLHRIALNRLNRFLLDECFGWISRIG